MRSVFSVTWNFQRFGRGHVMAALISATFLAFSAPILVWASGNGSQSEAMREEGISNQDGQQKAYQHALDAAAAMQVVRRQQPSNSDALRANYTQLKTNLSKLCAPTTVRDAPQTPVPQAETAEQASIGAAQGPIKPSTEPSRSEDVEARRRATEETFLSPGLIEDPSEPALQLALLNEEQMSVACVELEDSIRDLESAIAEPEGGLVIDEALARVRARLEAMGIMTPK